MPYLDSRSREEILGRSRRAFLARLTFSCFAAPYLVELSQGYLTKQTVPLDFGGGFNAYLTRELLKKGVAVRLYEPSLHETQLTRIFERTRSSLKRTYPSRQTDMTSSLPRK
jgi:hypothetical protein